MRAGTPIKPQFCTQNIRAYAVPNCFSGIIFGTEGHMAEGTNENAMPKTIIINVANHHSFRIGSVKRKCTPISIIAPSIMMEAPLPLRS